MGVVMEWYGVVTALLLLFARRIPPPLAEPTCGLESALTFPLPDASNEGILEPMFGCGKRRARKGGVSTGAAEDEVACMTVVEK